MRRELAFHCPWRGSFLTAVLGTLLGLSTPVLAQTQAQAPVELQETGRFGFGARAMGMGGAYQAVSEDVAAMLYNPAGLAQIRRIEFSAGLSHDETATSFGRGTIFDTERSNTRLEHLALAYPYPTYRGSVVVGFAFHRAADLEQDLFTRGALRDLTQPDEVVLRTDRVDFDDIIQKGMVNAWTAGAAMDISPHISVGATLTYLSGDKDESLIRGVGSPVDDCPQGLDDYGLHYGCADPSEIDLFKQSVERQSNLDGFTGSLGLLARLDNGLRLAAGIDLPRWLQYEGSENVVEETAYFREDFDTVFFIDEITLPMSLKAGASWATRGLLLSADLKWTDWKQTDFEGDIRGTNRDFAYRATTAISLGAEVQLPFLYPVRVRGGWSLDPIPYRYLAGDNLLSTGAGDDGVLGTLDDVIDAQRVYQRADIVSDRSWFTLGAGVLIQEGLTLDLAYLHGSWERMSEAGSFQPGGFPTREDVSRDRLFMTASFHFE